MTPGLDKKKPVRSPKEPEPAPEPVEKTGDPPKKGWLARFFGDG